MLIEDQIIRAVFAKESRTVRGPLQIKIRRMSEKIEVTIVHSPSRIWSSAKKALKSIS